MIARIAVPAETASLLERAEEAPLAAGLRRAPGARIITGMRALVADDNEVCRDVAAAQLALLGFTVTTVDDGGKAIEAIDRQGAFDLVLVDWSMGPPDGHELIRRLRQRPDTHRVCICLWTGDATQERRDAAMRSGANAVLPKPFAITQLAVQLSQLGLMDA